MENRHQYQQVFSGEDSSIYALFENAADRFPDHTAVVSDSEKTSYADLAARVGILAAQLIQQAPEEQIIAVSTSRSLEMIVAVLAIVKSGKAYLPLDPSYPDQRLSEMIAGSGVRFCICPPAEESRFQELSLKCINHQDQSIEPLLQAIVAPQVYVLYTSGSTGKPKGVYMNQLALFNLLKWQIEESLTVPECRTLQFAPLSFDVSFQEIWSTLITGATLYLISDDLRLDPHNLLHFIEKHQIDRIFLPFVALQFLAEAAAGTDLFPRCLREVMTAGEQLKITPQVRTFFERLPECILYNQYGPTECHVVTQLKLSGDPHQWPVLPNIGFPIWNTEILMLDETLAILAPGETGELAIAGSSLAHGYLNQPELTAEKFIRLPANDLLVYRTGDIARLAEDGSIDFLGRRDDQVKIRGYRIELGEVEVRMNHIPGIKQAVVVSREFGGQHRLLAYVIANDPEMNTTALRAAMEADMPDYMVPSVVIWVDEFPKTSSGKIDKKNLPLPERKRPDLANPYSPAKTALEKQIASIWAAILEIDEIGTGDNFFELGGNSLLALKTVTQLRTEYGVVLPITKLYQFPTITQIADFLNPGNKQIISRIKKANPEQVHEAIAIIGMEGRFPGANSIEELWAVLAEGRETTSFFKPEEMDPAIPETVLHDPNYVRARGILKDAAQFDPTFFGISPKLAEVMDPQHRIFLEISRDVLEKTGYLPAVYQGVTGVFAGCGNNSYYPNNVVPQQDLVNQVGVFQVMTANEKDYISSRTAYQLNLKGPAVSVFSACSTSLLAIAQAVDSLRRQQCDIAVAGGVSITSPIYSGHLYQEGAMLSKDGHCRSFDADATGTVFSDGAGVVLLKPLSAAERDGDTIYGLIKGTGINNDGHDKGSFTAPNTIGQATAIAMAIADAGIEAREIGYIETHGTATPLGDPIEIEGLKLAFGDQEQRNFCAIGSIKSNMGHMTAAAGVGGLIKTTLALHHGKIPASINFDKPNPELRIEDSPFYVCNQLQSWPENRTRFAGVSSFGVGGTNVHVILEGYERSQINEELTFVSDETEQLILWSAKSQESLDLYADALQKYQVSNPEKAWADLAYTLATTREDFNQRRFTVSGRSSFETQLARASNHTVKRVPGETIFMFPGQGAQYPGMGKELYETEPVFREAADRCANLLKEYVDLDIRKLLYEDYPDAAELLNQTQYTQPALFLTSYALGSLWISWNIKPDLLCGHSIGEYVAAHFAGVMSLEDALHLIAIRGLLVSKLPGGSMLSVRENADRIKAMLPADLSVAAINSPQLCVVAGTNEAVEAFQEVLDTQSILHKKLFTSHAFHSAMMDPILEEFEQLVRKIKLEKPRKPIISTVTGTFITDAEATDPLYWTEHLRKTVRFSSALETISTLDFPVLLEAGPGNTCSTLAWQQLEKGKFTAIASLEKKEISGGRNAILNALGKLWLAGLQPDWAACFQHNSGRRIDLPTYSYQKKTYWAQAARPVLHHTKDITIMPKQHFIEKIKNILENASGIEMDGVTPDMSFIEIGLDSLLLTQVAITLKNEFALPITFRQLNEEYATIDALAGYVSSKVSLPAPEPAQPLATTTAPSAASPVYQAQTHAPLVQQNYTTFATGNMAPANSALGLIAQQLQLLSKQVELLTGFPQENAPQQVPSASTTLAAAIPAPATMSAALPATPSANGLKVVSDISAEEMVELKKPFGATARIEKSASAMTEKQLAFLKDLIVEYNQKTPKSKAFNQQYRAKMADPRVVSGFKPYTKEIVYSIVTDRSKGSHLWDIDGNEYIDALNGFGSNLLGYQHPVLKAAILEQIEKGYEIGPQHALAGEVCELLCEFTNFDRAALCNTGSEAVLGAMRIARTVTGRSLIVAFSGSYHGINDEVIVRGTKKLKSFAAAPGIMPEAVQNMLILDYGTPETLAIIKERAHELAAVLVEPVQSRRPEFQPVDFLKEVRTITSASNTVLIFDEVITGFRAHPGGAQAIFGIQADLGTYGKVIGGGLPIGAIAGKKQFMDALDGGFWQYGDQSFPEVGVTYFAGTFVRHPLALAAGKASLLYMKAQGPALQKKLNDSTTALAAKISNYCTQKNIPVYAASFGSLWKIKFQEEYPYSELIFNLMRLKGIHIWDGFPCFLTEAHTPEEIDAIFAAFASSVDALLEVNLIPFYQNTNQSDSSVSTASNQAPVAGAKLGKDENGNPAWFIENPDAPGKYLQIETK